MPIFSEWWLAKEKFSMIDSFILSSFPGATFQGCNGLSVKYQVKIDNDSRTHLATQIRPLTFRFIHVVIDLECSCSCHMEKAFHFQMFLDTWNETG